jgi:hypothetical protein
VQRSYSARTRGFILQAANFRKPCLQCITSKRKEEKKVDSRKRKKKKNLAVKSIEEIEEDKYQRTEGSKNRIRNCKQNRCKGEEKRAKTCRKVLNLTTYHLRRREARCGWCVLENAPPVKSRCSVQNAHYGRSAAVEEKFPDVCA